MILRTERTDGLNGASSFPAGLFGGALLVDTELRLGFFSAALVFTGNGLKMEARFAFFKINTYSLLVIAAKQINSVMPRDDHAKIRGRTHKSD